MKTPSEGLWSDCILDPKKGIGGQHPIPEAVLLTVLERMKEARGTAEQGMRRKAHTLLLWKPGLWEDREEEGTTSLYLDKYSANMWKENL